MKFVNHQTTLHLSFKIKCCVDRLSPPGQSGQHMLVLSSSQFDPTRSPSVHRSSGKNHCRAAPAVTPSMCLLSRCSGLAISWILTVILFLEHCLTSFLLPQLASSPFWIAVVKFVPTSKITIYCVSSSR